MLHRPCSPLLGGSVLLSAAAAWFPAFGQEPILLPEISVTASSPIATRESGTFMPTTALDRETIERRPGATLGGLLFAEPGVTSTSFAPGAGRPVIRGLDNFRVRIQENGIGTHDASTLGEDHGVPVDPLAAERVEVVRGPATLRWGSQAIGGVVDVSNNRIPTDLLLPDSAQTRVLGGIGSVDRGLDGAAIFDGRVGNIAVHADVFARDADDYRVPSGSRQDNSGVRSNGQSWGLSYLLEDGYVGTAITRFSSVYGIPGGEEAELDAGIDMEQIKWSSRGEFRFDTPLLRSARFWLGYSRYRHDEIGLEHEHEEEHGHEEEDHDSASEEGEHVHGTFANRAWEGRLELQHATVATGIGPLNGALGFQFNHDRLRTRGEAAEFLSNADTTRVAGYLFEELDLTETLKLQAAGRIESVSIDGSAPDISGLTPPPDEIATRAVRRSFAPGGISIGVLQQLPWDLTARLTAQVVQRAPEAAELFSKGSHHASGTFEIGNPDLGKESARTIEIGLGRTTGAVRFDASAYYTRYKDFIYKALTGLTCDEAFSSCGEPDGEFDQIVYAQQNATFYGVELEAAFDLFSVGTGVIGIDGRYDFVRAEFADDTNVPRIPPHRLGGGLYWRDGNWSARVSLLHAFDQNRTAPFESETSGYDLLNAEISYGWTIDAVPGQPLALNIGLSGTNLLDEDIRNAVSFKKDEVLLPGRGVRLFTSLKF